MSYRALSRQIHETRECMRGQSGQSLVEIALMTPVLMLLTSYAIDFGFFFIVAASITSAAQHAAQYSVLGYSGPAQTNVPAAGPFTTTNSVASTALAELTGFAASATTTTVQVCSKDLGMNGNIPVCARYGPTETSYAPTPDPEAPRFVLHRVDVTYTVQPPIPLSVLGVSLLPNLNFHREVSMRVMD